MQIAFRNIRRSALLTFSTLLVSGLGTGCFHDGESTQTGVFRGTVVEGLSYTTATISGRTDSEGRYFYQNGETIRFSIGDVVLGEVAGSNAITTFSLLGAERLTGISKIPDTLGNAASRFTHAVNMLRLLQSLDDDSDPSNGVLITEAMHRSLKGVSLNFSQSTREFSFDPNTYNLMLALGRELISPAIALNNSYSALNINLMDKDGSIHSREVSIIRDDSVDGVPDSISLSTYDAAGNKVRYESDRDLDGLLDEVTICRYSPAGNAIYQASGYDDNFLTSVMFSTFQYNASGYRIRNEIDSDNGSAVDGLIDEIDKLTFNGDGNLVGLEYDMDADGVADIINTMNYDSQDKMTRKFIEDRAWMNQTSFNTIEYFYDGMGNISKTTEEKDIDGDGIVDSYPSYSYRYDTNGNKIRAESDSDGDGILDRIETWAYDSNGNEIRYDIDDGADGVLTYIEISSYDSHGNKTYFEFDYGADGVPEGVQVWDYSYDDNGKIARLETGNSITTYEYDAGGNVIRSVNDIDRDGLADFAYTYVLEPNRRYDQGVDESARSYQCRY